MFDVTMSMSMLCPSNTVKHHAWKYALHMYIYIVQCWCMRESVTVHIVHVQSLASYNIILLCINKLIFYVNPHTT